MEVVRWDQRRPQRDEALSVACLPLSINVFVLSELRVPIQPDLSSSAQPQSAFKIYVYVRPHYSRLSFRSHERGV